MKIFMIECNAEELRANRTVLDSLGEALSGFTRAFAGVDVTAEALADGMAEEEEQEGEE